MRPDGVSELHRSRRPPAHHRRERQPAESTLLDMPHRPSRSEFRRGAQTSAGTGRAAQSGGARMERRRHRRPCVRGLCTTVVAVRRPTPGPRGLLSADDSTTPVPATFRRGQQRSSSSMNRANHLSASLVDELTEFFGTASAALMRRHPLTGGDVGGSRGLAASRTSEEQRRRSVPGPHRARNSKKSSRVTTFPSFALIEGARQSSGSSEIGFSMQSATKVRNSLGS